MYFTKYIKSYIILANGVLKMKSDKWIQPTIDLKKIGTDPNKIITVQNSGVLETDFYKYANNFHEAADVVLMQDKIDALVDAIKISRKTRRVRTIA